MSEREDREKWIPESWKSRRQRKSCDDDDKEIWQLKDSVAIDASFILESNNRLES